MKNILIVYFFTIFFFLNKTYAENLLIEAENISIDKKTNTTIFKNNVVATTKDNAIIKSDYAEYNKIEGFLKLKKNIIATDIKGNEIKTEYAEYYKDKQTLKSVGATTINTHDGYFIKTEDIFVDNKKKFINSEKNSIIIDSDDNQIFLENFNYQTSNNIFKSIGYIKIEDKNDNIYEFSQIYIDTQKKEILGSDTKSYLNQKSFKINEKNKPRVFSNTLKINKDKTTFAKSIFTLCDYRKNDKCPPWSIQSSQMLHDSKKKTIYYKNAIVKIYDIPIFYIPRLSHPDPTVDRRSGFLNPSFYDTKNLGEGIAVPYFFNLGVDKNFTLTNRLYASENPLFLGEYHQAFMNTNFLADFGYTEGYKETSATKKAGDKLHFFSKITKKFNTKKNSDSNLDLTLQHVSNDKYLKLYRINSNLVDYAQDTLENSIDYTLENEDLFFGFKSSVYETIKEDYEDKYEYILPEITLDKNIFNNNNGILDLQSNFKVHNFDTNKLTSFFVNDFNWSSKTVSHNSGLNTKLLGNIKNINYEAKNVDLYKKDLSNEVYGALGLMSELKLQKLQNNSQHILKPKVLVRYAPDKMRKETSGSRLSPITAFKVNKLNNINNFETGLSSTIGFDYKIKNNNKTNFDFSIAQVISEKENKKMASITSLDEKLSDIVGSSKLKINENLDINYNFAIDQNYNDFNYTDIGAKLNFGPSNINFNYLQENKHIGNQDYFTTKINLNNNDDGIFSFETKRNLITNSAEYYNLGYEYLNDCLRAGLVYRREFYNDSELEPENSLMFKITLTPFGNIETPSFSQ